MTIHNDSNGNENANWKIIMEWGTFWIYQYELLVLTMITHLPILNIMYIVNDLTHWDQDKMAAISQTAFSNALYWMQMFELHLKFHWGLFPKCPVDKIPALVQIMASRRSNGKPLSEPMMVTLLMHICITQPQWVKSGTLKLEQINSVMGLQRRLTALNSN